MNQKAKDRIPNQQKRRPKLTEKRVREIVREEISESYQNALASKNIKGKPS
jgi:hypothetical protein